MYSLHDQYQYFNCQACFRMVGFHAKAINSKKNEKLTLNYFAHNITKKCLCVFRWAEVNWLDTMVQYKPDGQWSLDTEVPLRLHGQRSGSKSHQDQPCQNTHSLLHKWKQYLLQTRWDIQWNRHKKSPWSCDTKVLQTPAKTVQ